jgi:hypothetical protein
MTHPTTSALLTTLRARLAIVIAEGDATEGLEAQIRAAEALEVLRARSLQVAFLVGRIGALASDDAMRALRMAHVLVAGARGPEAGGGVGVGGGLSPAHFGNFLRALPVRLPMHWDAADARAFFVVMAAALQRDALTH